MLLRYSVPLPMPKGVHCVFTVGTLCCYKLYVLLDDFWIGSLIEHRSARLEIQTTEVISLLIENHCVDL